MQARLWVRCRLFSLLVFWLKCITLQGDLMAKFDFLAKRLQWEVVSSGVKLTIGAAFDEIAGLGLELVNQTAVFTIEFNRSPSVHWEGGFSSFLSSCRPLIR